MLNNLAEFDRMQLVFIECDNPSLTPSLPACRPPSLPPSLPPPAKSMSPRGLFLRVKEHIPSLKDQIPSVGLSRQSATQPTECDSAGGKAEMRHRHKKGYIRTLTGLKSDKMYT